MNKLKVNEIVNDVILDRITSMIEEMSTNEFLDMIVDKLEQEGIEVNTDNEEEMEEVKSVIGGRVPPLLLKMSEYLIGKPIPTE